MKQPLLSHVLGQRALGFERMEDRLALSATMGGDYTLLLDYLNVDQGGFVVLDRAFFQAAQDRLAGANFEIVFSNHPHVEGYFHDLLNNSSEAGVSAEDTDQIAPIPQPNNQGKLGGMIELTNIFQPSTRQNSLPSEQQVAQSTSVTDALQLSALDSQSKEPSLARGRDMYFEVASLLTKVRARGRGVVSASQEELIPINHDVSVGVSKPVLPDSKLRDAETKHNSVPAVPPTIPIPKANSDSSSPSAKSDLLRAAEKAAGDAATKSARQVQPTSTADDLPTASAHDAALAELWSDELLADEVAVSLRTNEGGKHFAAWPTLAVLVGGGIVARQRRMTRVNACQLQPPRRKFMP